MIDQYRVTSLSLATQRPQKSLLRLQEKIKGWRNAANFNIFTQLSDQSLPLVPSTVQKYRKTVRGRNSTQILESSRDLRSSEIVPFALFECTDFCGF